MARYIDADALIERILKLKVVTDDMYGMGIARGIERAETAIQMQPTADVVPKSEIDNLKVMLEMQEKAYESLKELYDMDTEALIKAREKTEVEVAREIFEEIEKNTGFFRACALYNHDYLCIFRELDELKKKYTEEKE